MKKLVAFKSSLAALIVFASLISCKKNNTGGDASIVATTEHHAQPIYGSTVYVKFGAKDLPSNPLADADLIVVGKPFEERVLIENLRYGNYYLYAVGYDSALAETVKGGAGVTIKWGERKSVKEIDLSVTE